jgi:aminoglycoside phosphotransferase (APT) family kinase protein
VAVLPHTDAAFLGQFLRDVLGPRGSLLSYDVLKAADDYLVLHADLGGRGADVTVKLAGPRARLATPFDQAAHVNNLARRAGVPTGEVLAADATSHTWPWRYLISTWLEGETWASVAPRLQPRELERVYREFGAAVAALHTIQFPDFGELTVDGLVRSDGSYITALIARARRRLPLLSSPAYAELFQSAVEANARLFSDPPTPCLSHDDLNHTNIILRSDGDSWRLAGIIDFEAAWAGSCEPDLARLEFWRGMVDASFWQSYHDVLPVTDGFWRRRHIQRLLWCLEFARPTPGHLADTAQVCAALGIAPVIFRG